MNHAPAPAEPGTPPAPVPEAHAGESAAPGPAAASSVRAAAPLREPQAVAEALKQRFPALFGGAPKPIKLKIQADIDARCPGAFTRQALTAFLRRHTGTTAYLRALVRSAQRFDLDGNPAGELSPEHKAAAQAALNERQERIKARDAEMQAARRWRADLLRDWERSNWTRGNFCALKGVADEALDALLAQARQEALEPAPAPQRPVGRPPQGERKGEGRGDRGARKPNDRRTQGQREGGRREPQKKDPANKA